MVGREEAIWLAGIGLHCASVDATLGIFEKWILEWMTYLLKEFETPNGMVAVPVLKISKSDLGACDVYSREMGRVSVGRDGTRSCSGLGVPRYSGLAQLNNDRGLIKQCCMKLIIHRNCATMNKPTRHSHQNTSIR